MGNGRASDEARRATAVATGIQRRDQRGDSLVEILIALAIIGILVVVSFAGLTTATRASTVHRESVTDDTALRNFAETIKSDVQQQCVGGASTYTISFTYPNYTFSPLGTQSCPPAATTSASDPPWQPLTLTATGPDGVPRTLPLVVRSS